MEDFSGRPGVAFVAGGTGGIGSAIVRTLAARGSAAVFTYRARREAAQALADEVKGAVPLALDLTDEAATARAVTASAEAYGGIHTLVYAAGPHVPMRHLSRVSPAEYRAQLEADAVAFFNLAHPALPVLRRSRGGIVAVTTVATRRFPVRDGLSSGAKGAVEAVARALAAEEGRYGVRVNCVAPGMLTDGIAGRLIDSGELNDEALAVTRRNIPLRRFGRRRTSRKRCPSSPRTGPGSSRDSRWGWTAATACEADGPRRRRPARRPPTARPAPHAGGRGADTGRRRRRSPASVCPRAVPGGRGTSSARPRG